MIATPLTKTIKIDPDQVQDRNGQENVRVFSPDATDYLQQILEQTKQTNYHLQILTEESYDN